ncbi:MAG: hypothetical protein NXH73_00810 [Flavobacteriaceae bacterium]|nr:hypothetical protein [Flavobacteriaceae bacterium]
MPRWLNGNKLNKEQITYLLQNPEKSSENTKVQLEEIISNFPYFQPARAIYLNLLKKENSYLYNQELKKTAAYTSDRTVLFDFITSEHFSQQPVLKKEEIEEIDKNEIEKAEAILNPNLFERKKEKTTQEKAIEEILEVHKPLPFSKNDKHSFEEWLKLTRVKPIKRNNNSEETENEKEDKFRLIDKFIQESPKIKPSLSDTKEDTEKPLSKPSNHLMTETLAKVYLQQNNYKKAIQAYKILILKNPEKSGFFADQIRAIEKLQQNN